MKNFYDAENTCLYHFAKAGDFWHLWTRDSFQIIFTNDDDFKAGMFIVGLAVTLVPGLKLITFELMSNHFHFTLAGSESQCRDFFRILMHYLDRYFRVKGRILNLESLECKLRRLNDIQDVRNVITYNNRNGFLMHREHSPYSYPWGANSYFFSPNTSLYYQECKKPIPIRSRRSIIHSHAADSSNGIMALNGYACPLSYCDITLGERMFRNASHYFHEVSRNIEGQKSIAKEIGEGIFYTDDELYRIVSAECLAKYSKAPSLIPSEAKIEMAKMMRYDYNAGNQQILRILKIDSKVHGSLFMP